MENTAQRIMVVDDEAHICHSVEKILKKNNFQVDTATSAKEALEKMALESYSLLISDIVMPGTNGLDLLKLVKSQWPLTKAMMMTAYASTDTAMKAIRLGALDYLPKPFTPTELREKVDLILSGGLQEAPATEKEKEGIKLLDVDMPFDREEVARATGEHYADLLSRSDMPVVEVKASEPLPNFCDVGNMVCDIFKKLGATCKGGVKSQECPQKKAKKGLGESRVKSFDGKVLIGIDEPFNYQEVIAVTGPEYVQNLNHGFSFVTYEELKKNYALMMEKEAAGSHHTGVLVIDDEVAVNNNIRKILEKTNLEVDQAFTKSEALAKIHSGFYQLVLLDLKIPGVKGLELLEEIKRKLPETRVIIVTGYASIETAIETARLGAVDYLAKPFTPDEIRQVTDNAIQLAA